MSKLEYLKNNNQTSKDLWQAFHKGQWQVLQNKAHSLKSSSASIGAQNVYEASKILEIACQDEVRMPENKQLIIRLEEALDQVLKSLEKLI